MAGFPFCFNRINLVSQISQAEIKKKENSWGHGFTERVVWDYLKIIWPVIQFFKSSDLGEHSYFIYGYRSNINFGKCMPFVQGGGGVFWLGKASSVVLLD